MILKQGLQPQRCKGPGSNNDLDIGVIVGDKVPKGQYSNTDVEIKVKVGDEHTRTHAGGRKRAASGGLPTGTKVAL